MIHIAELKETLNDLHQEGALIPLWEGEDISEEWIYTCQQMVQDLEKVPVHTKPPTERALFEHQLDFYKGYGNSDALQDLFITMVPYTRSLILKFKKHRNFITKENLKNMANEVTLRVVEQYLRRPGFMIDASFAGYIKWKVLEVTGEADDLERAKQLDPATGKQRIMPLLSLNSLLEARGKETSLEELQSTLNFTHIGGAPVSEHTQFDTLYQDQVVLGVMNIVKGLLLYINDTAEYRKNPYKRYSTKLFTLLTFHVLFSSGQDAFHKFTNFCPSPKLRLLLNETVGEIFSFLKESSTVEHL